jgi:FXSXX-COOH protein
MSLSVQESVVISDVPDLREIPIGEIAASISSDMSEVMRRIMPLGTDSERPAVSAFNSSI